ncbi:Protein of unknown function [Bacillus wiedmannii]|uniref:Uncharacterized protein n=1 Tax=Bacillus wiedmannii TaxID=1890302 RepID=A0AB37YYV5_9BACI|nr:Protein of unknown function [Bacillus wiedmannii]
MHEFKYVFGRSTKPNS